LVALLAAHLVGDRYVVRPLRALLGATERIRQGDLTARSGLREDSAEIEQLGAAFDQMAESLQQRQDELQRTAGVLRESEAKYRALVEQAPVGVFLYDDDLRITSCNP